MNGNSKLRLMLKLSVVTLCLGLVMAVSNLFVTRVKAHAYLDRSEPANGATLDQAPEQIIAWFTQELDTGFSTIQVFDADGHQVDAGDGGVDLFDPDHASMTVSLPPSLPSGAYLVRWVAVSGDDGDVTQGEFNFGIGQAVEKIEPSSAETDATVPTDREIIWPMVELGISLGILLAVVVGVVIIPYFIRRRASTSLKTEIFTNR